MQHQHARPQCCSDDHEPTFNHKTDAHHHHDEHNHDVSGGSSWKMFLPAIASFVMLALGITLDNLVPAFRNNSWLRTIWYTVAYLPVGLPVVRDALRSITKGAVFSEFFLMTLATVGAFAIGEYPEAVAVMLFYAVGELFQSLAVSRAKGNIKALLDQRPQEVTLLQDGQAVTVHPQEVVVGSIIQLKPGELLALDGILRSERASFNTAALTGESVPDTKKAGETVWAGMLNINTVAEVTVTKPYEDSKLSKILDLVQNATTRKAPTELFIRKFAKIYTPIVVFLALGIFLLPALWEADYQYKEWLYRALIFLVISCPCALVISIPLGYFGGIGAASRNGILFKGSNFLDALANIRHVVMDKTGTLTAGIFEVQEIFVKADFDKGVILDYVNIVERNSTHPVARAVNEYLGAINHGNVVGEVEELPGLGMKAIINDKELLVGNTKLLDAMGIDTGSEALNDSPLTTLLIAYDRQYAGYITIADSIKDDAGATINQLHQMGVQTTMLSGDKPAVVAHVAGKLQIVNAFGGLLPEGKVAHMEAIQQQPGTVAFVGDGVNDAPVLALSNVGIAMGGLGSDAAIETADVVIQDDKPSKIPVAIKIGKATKAIVWQNIFLAFGVKLAVLILGAGGLATMWEAVFADVGVALLAVLNAVRIQRKQF